MDDKPIDKQDILEKLNELHKLDHDYADGRILGSMCTQAHPFAKEVFCKFLDTNLGDPGLFKGTKQIENEVIKSIGKILSLDNAYGNIVTGGTEANLMAIRAARNHARKYKGITDGEIILPDNITGEYSYEDKEVTYYYVFQIKPLLLLQLLEQQNWV